MRTLSSLVLAAALALSACSSSGSRAQSPASTPAASGDIVDIAASNPDFSTLVTAVKAADLVDTLKGPGPFTVFAPTNDAFARLPAGALDALLADKAALTKVLTYHVVAGKVGSGDVVKLTRAATVQGGEIMIDSSDGVRINGAKVVITDIQASNGVIHVIDTVLLPE
jgi:uncharacterized surface protein with fasciclin (FAS1) repeats